MNSRNPTSASPSFVEAQRQLAARRRDRAIQIQQINSSSRAGALLARPPLPLQPASGAGAGTSSTQTRLQRVGTFVRGWTSRVPGASSSTATSTSTSTSPFPSFRVGQVDAELLDEELLTLLRGQVGDALRLVRGGTLTDDWDAEIGLALRAALFKLTVWDHDATYGAALQNLRYGDARRSVGGRVAAPTRWQKALYGLATVGGRYAWTKWEERLRERDEFGEDVDSLALRLTTWASDAYAAAGLLSFLVFLRFGRYRTLLDRLLRMRLVAPTSQVNREVSFEYLNRQLVWHAFTEFLLFLLPLVGVHRWRRWAIRAWRGAKRKGSAWVGSSTSSEKTATPTTTGELSFLPERTCAICYQDQNAAATEADVLAAAAASSGVVGSAETDVTNPYETVPCGCVYCYVCVATRIEREEGDGWTCLRCGALVHTCRPWSGDVLGGEENTDERGGDHEPDRPSSSSTTSVHKTVGFADEIRVDREGEGEGEEEEEREEGNEEDEGEEGKGEGEERGDERHEEKPQGIRVDSSDTESEAYEEEEDEMNEMEEE